MPHALLILHLIGLMLGFAGVIGGMLTLGHARPAQKQKGGSLRGVGPAFAHLATFGLVLLLPTGVALMVTGKSFDPTNAMLWMKLVFAALLTFATVSVEMVYARARSGEPHVARILPSLGPLATISYLAVVVFSVLAFG
jgi:uncharacterized membrane protein SirB2